MCVDVRDLFFMGLVLVCAFARRRCACYRAWGRACFRRKENVETGISLPGPRGFIYLFIFLFFIFLFLRRRCKSSPTSVLFLEHLNIYIQCSTSSLALFKGFRVIFIILTREVLGFESGYCVDRTT